MARYGKVSRLSPDNLLEKALKFFGPGGWGLESKSAGPGCAQFEGGGGHVSISTSEKEKGTEVEIETQEWDYQVKEFLGKI